MAAPTPRVIGTDPSLVTQCLDFTKTLVNKGIGFNFQLSSGLFTFSFGNNGKLRASSARIPAVAKRKSPSTRKRNARRRLQYFENKKLQASDCDKPALNEQPPSACEKPSPPACNEPIQPASKEIAQVSSEGLCFPSPADFDSNDYCGGHIKKKLRMDGPKVPPLKVLVDTQSSSPIYRIEQVDGNCSLSDLNLCENDHPSDSTSFHLAHTRNPNRSKLKYTDDNTRSEILCDMCNCVMTTTHQCSDTTEIHTTENDITDILEKLRTTVATTVATLASVENKCGTLENTMSRFSSSMDSSIDNF